MADQVPEPLPPGYLSMLGNPAAPSAASAPANPWAGIASPVDKVPASPNMFDDLIPKQPPPQYGPAEPIPSHAAVAGQALLRGGLQATKELGESTAPFKDRPAAVPQTDYVGKLLAGSLSQNWKNPDWYTAQILNGAAGMYPSVAMGAAGAVAGGAAGGVALGPPGAIAGGAAGGAGGFALGSKLQTTAAAYQRARADGLDHDAAVDRAMQQTHVAEAWGAAMGMAPEVKLFGKVGTVVGDQVFQMAKKPISEALAQIFGVQPALGVSQANTEANLEGKQLTPGELATNYAQNVGVGGAMAGAHQAISGLRGTKLPPPAWGNVPDDTGPPGPPRLPPPAPLEPIDAEFSHVEPRLPTRDDLAAAILNPPGAPPSGGTTALLPAPAAPVATSPAPPPARPALAGDSIEPVAPAAAGAPTRDDLATAVNGESRPSPALTPPQSAPIAALPPPAAGIPPPAGAAPGENTPPASFKDSLKTMPDHQLIEISTGQNVRNRRMAREELDRRYPDKSVTTAMTVAEQAAQVAQNPSDAQKEAGNFSMGHVSIKGIPISIETPAGALRTGMGAGGRPWQAQMPNDTHYGYIKRTEGADGEHVDVFLGNHHNNGMVRVVDQINPDNGAFDEHKILMGFRSQDAARNAYIQSFSDGKGAARIGAITEMSIPKFKQWLKTGDQSKPLAYAEPTKLPEAPSKGPDSPSSPPADPAMFEDLVPKTSPPLNVKQNENFIANQGGETSQSPHDLQSVSSGTPAAEAEALPAVPRGVHAGLEEVAPANGAGAAEGQREESGEREQTPGKTGPSTVSMRGDGSGDAPPGLQPTAPGGVDMPAVPSGPSSGEEAPDEGGEPGKAPANPEEPSKSEIKGKKLQDVGEKMEGKRAFQDRMKGKTTPEQAKQIIESTKTKAAFDIEKREGQTDGVARFAQALVDKINNFSTYLKDERIIKQGDRSRYASGKVPGWEEQVKILFSDEAHDGGDVRLGHWRLSGNQAHEARRNITDSAEEYIDFGQQLSDMFKKSNTIAEFKSSLMKAMGDDDDETTDFYGLFTKFASTHGLNHDIFSSSEYSTFGSIKDTDVVKKSNRVEKTLSRPKLEHIERVGLKDYRQSRDVTPEEFRKEFGFRGVEFGEWVNAKEGQAHVNHAYDALHDLAHRLGISPSDISLGGKLGFAFGSRGSGEHAAHFEPDTNVINLTKTKGDGSVAHEWLHALDHNLRESGPGTKIMSGLTHALEQKLNPISDLENKIKQFLSGKIWYDRFKSAGPIGNAKKFIEYLTRDPYKQYSMTTNFKREGDQLGKGYWGTGKELLARAWEAFILDTLEGKSPYLVSDWAGDGVVTKESGYRGTPYPTGDERREFNGLFNDFIKLLEFSNTGVKIKDGAELPIHTERDKIIEAAGSFIPKLAAMMKEIDNGRVQQKGLQSGVPDSHEPAGPEDVLGAGEGRDIESPDQSGRGPSGGAVSGPSGESDSGGEHPGSGESDGNGSRVQRDDTVPAGTGPAKPVEYQSVGTNHKIAVGALDEKRGEKQKARDNLKIIKTVKEIENAARAATPEEQTLLAKYTGWGSIKKAFPNGEGKKFEGWEDIHDEVRGELTDGEYKEARRTIQFAHYTSEIIVRGMWKAFERFGLDKGTVFEPGMGVGNFAGMMPDSIKAQYSGLEYDGMTARIAKILYPESSVRHADFTAVSYANGMFDAAIGNPPFQPKGTGYKYDKVPVALHNYFFLKTIDMTAPGGIIGFVTSAGTMDNLNNNARQMMAKNVDLVGAVRLPNTAFKTNAHTDVVTDIIFLRKRLPSEESNGVKWADTAPVGLTDDEGRDIQVNEYFIAHPEMVLGNFTTGGTMYRKGALTVDPVENRDLEQQLAEAIARLPEKIVTEIQKANTEAMDMEPPEKKEGSYYIKNGALFQVVDEKGRPVAGRPRSDGGLTKLDTDKVVALIPIRDALRKTINAMVARDDKAMQEGQKELRTAYDKFVKKYGYISKSEVITRAPTSGQLEAARDELRAEYEAMEMDFDEGDTDLNHLVGAINPETGKKYTSGQISTVRDRMRAEAIEKGQPYSEGTFKPEEEPANVSIKYPNLDAMKMDQESYNLLVLEKLDEKTGETNTTDFFTKNVVGEMKKPEIKTAVDALNHSLVTKNGIDVPLMAQALGKNPESVIQELEELDLIFNVPDGDGGKTPIYKEEYLSGHVKDKLSYAKKLAAKDSSYQRNVTALESVQPADIPVSLINTQLGAKYFDTKVIEDFMGEELNIHASVKYIGLINAWEVRAYDEYAPENTSVYGTDKRYAHEIMESLLMRKPIQVTIKDPDGKTHVDIDATKAAQEKSVTLQNRFDNWIWKSQHGEKVFRKYQDEYNNIAPRVFDGKHLTTAISPSINLYAHQKDAVWRVIQSGNTYLAHAVGSGKTLEMTVATMEMRRLGQWKKPLQIVPNHMLGQFTKEYREAYPQAKLLIADEHHFDADRRTRFVRTVAAGDYDCVIMTEASFSKVPISKEFEAQTIENELFKYRQALEASSQGRKQKVGRGTPAARLEKQIQKMEERLKSMKAKNQDQAFTFEQLGVDALLVDEAHSFRKLSFQTMQGNVNGIDPVGSKKAWDMFIKSRFLDTVHPGRNLVFASGTPLTNTMAEVYTIQRFLYEKDLKDRGLDTFDGWSSTFTSTVTRPERQVSGKYKNVTRLALFKNVGVLSPMIRQFMDVVTSEELGNKVDRPVMKSGQMMLETVPPTREYQAYQKYLAVRTEEIAKNPNRGEKGADIILSVITDGRLAAIDMRLIDPTLPEQNSKLEHMITQTYEEWKRESDTEYRVDYKGTDISPIKGSTQLIFSDLGVNGRFKNGKTFSAYDHIRKQLIKYGVPSSQIAMAGDYETTEEKRRLYRMVNNGEIRVLIGSTSKMGTGMNVQNRLKSIRNLDAPHNPSDLEQRNGRGLRQGNQNKEIGIYAYSTDGSYDSQTWDTLQRKARYIRQFMKGESNEDMADITDDVNMFDLARAMTAGDARLIKEVELRGKVDDLQRGANNFDNEQMKVKTDIMQKKNGIEFRENEIKLIDEALKIRKEPPKDTFMMTVMGKPYDVRADASNALGEAVDKMTKDQTATEGSGVKIGEYQGFDVRIFIGKEAITHKSNVAENAIIMSCEVFLDHPALAQSGKEWKVNLARQADAPPFSGSGAITVLTNGIDKMEGRKTQAAATIKENERGIKVLESQITDKYPKAAELVEKREELNVIQKDLQDNAPVDIVYEDYPVDYWRDNKDATAKVSSGNDTLKGGIKDVLRNQALRKMRGN